MVMIHEQPSDAQEEANAAYVWRKKVQSDLVESLRKVDITLESAEFWFERFRRAYKREKETEAIAKAEKEKSSQP